MFSSYLIGDQTLSNLGSAVRSFTQTSEYYTPAQMISQISDYVSVVPRSKYAQSTITEYIDSNVMIVQNNAFYGCSALSNVVLDNCFYIEERAFYACPALTSISLPKVQGIAEGAFYNVKLSLIDLPNCRAIAQAAFNSSSTPESVSAPKLEYVYYAFSSCTALSYLYLPNCKRIFAAFGSCTALQTVSIPNCELLLGSAFYRCTSLREVYLDKVKSVTAINTQGGLPFNGCTNLTSIYVPSSLYSAFQTASFWSTYSSLYVPV